MAGNLIRVRVILYLLLGILISPFIYRRYADAYDDYKRFVPLMRG